MELVGRSMARTRYQQNAELGQFASASLDRGGNLSLLVRQIATACMSKVAGAASCFHRAALYSLLAAGWISFALGTAAAQTPAPTNSGLPKFYSLKSNPVNLRKGPGTQFPMAWIYRREGLPVEVLRAHERWRQVRDSDGATGWILRTLISQRRTALVAPWLLKEHNTGRQQPGGSAAQTNKLIAMRSGARARANLVAQLEVGTLVNLKTCDGTWCQISVGRFRGYVEQNLLWGIYPREVLR